MRMPSMSGLEALQALQASGSLPPTIILTTFDDDQLVLAGIKAGARGYLLKDVTLEQLVSAIRTVAGGGSLVQPAVTQRLLSGLEHMHNAFVSLEQPDPLTDRETEILRLMAGGFFQQGDRQFAGRGRRHREEPRIEYFVQARRARSDPRSAQGLRTQSGLIEGYPARTVGPSVTRVAHGVRPLAHACRPCWAATPGPNRMPSRPVPC